MESPFSAWESFYVIVGSGAAGLTGLQFVVIALIADVKRPSAEGEIDAFATPSIVHFCEALLISSILSAPWPRVLEAAFAVAACGVFGLGYVMVVFRRARQHMSYQPVLEDWVWHVVLPAISYLALLVASARLPRHDLPPQFVVAGASLMLLFIGIHNAWDTVRFIVTGADQSSSKPSTDK